MIRDDDESIRNDDESNVREDTIMLTMMMESMIATEVMVLMFAIDDDDKTLFAMKRGR